MAKQVCTICGWIYDESEGHPGSGLPPGTPWDKVPEDFRCPKCGAKKKWFKSIL